MIFLKRQSSIADLSNVHAALPIHKLHDSQTTQEIMRLHSIEIIDGLQESKPEHKHAMCQI